MHSSAQFLINVSQRVLKVCGSISDVVVEVFSFQEKLGALVQSLCVGAVDEILKMLQQSPAERILLSESM